jgi:hypothetical protein
MTTDVEGYSGWALVEQMGFRKTVGRVREVEQYGTKMLRLDVPVFADGKVTEEYVTRFCGGPSLYQVTPLSEEVAIDAARRQGDPRPVKPTQYQIEDQSDDQSDDDFDAA